MLPSAFGGTRGNCGWSNGRGRSVSSPPGALYQFGLFGWSGDAVAGRLGSRNSQSRWNDGTSTAPVTGSTAPAKKSFRSG